MSIIKICFLLLFNIKMALAIKFKATTVQEGRGIKPPRPLTFALDALHEPRRIGSFQLKYV